MFFSIVIPSYNREKKVLKAIQSILNQTYKNYEIIVVDDGSTDTTEENIKLLNQTEVIRYFKTENLGVAHARNYGILKSKGKYVGFLDSDDLMEPYHLQSAFDLIQEQSSPEIIHLNFLFGNENKDQVQKNKLPKKLPDDLFKSCSLHVNCLFVRADIAVNNLFNESRELMFAEDWDYFIKLAIRYPIRLLDKTSSYLTDHEDRSMRDFDEVKWIKKRDALIRSLTEDPYIQKNHIKSLKKVSAHMNSLIALNFAIRKKRLACLHFWMLSARQNLPELFTKRTLAILKHLLIF